MKVYSALNPPPRVVVKKKTSGKVVPDQSLSVKDIVKRYRKTGNYGNVVENIPQYPDQKTLSHDSPDFLKLSNSSKLDKADLLKETNASLAKEEKKRKDAAIAAAKAAKEAAEEAAKKALETPKA